MRLFQFFISSVCVLFLIKLQMALKEKNSLRGNMFTVVVLCEMVCVLKRSPRVGWLRKGRNSGCDEKVE